MRDNKDESESVRWPLRQGAGNRERLSRHAGRDRVRPGRRRNCCRSRRAPASWCAPAGGGACYAKTTAKKVFGTAEQPTLARRSLSDPGKLFSWQPVVGSVGSWLSAPGSFFVSSAQAVRAVGQPPPASEAWSRAPAPRRFAHRTTDMAPMLRHADPCRASPCRPCCLLSALNRARPRSRALSSPGAKAAEAAPIPGMLSFESSSSFALSLGDLLVQTPFQRRARRKTPATQAS